MTPSQRDVLFSLAAGPQPWRAIEASTGRDGRTVRRALSVLVPELVEKIDGRAVTYKITEAGLAALKDGQPPMGALPSPSLATRGRPSPSPSPSVARGSCSTSISEQVLEEECSSGKRAQAAHGRPRAALPTAHGRDELLDAHEELLKYVRRLERELAELRGGVFQEKSGSQSGGARPPHPSTEPDGALGTGAGSSGSGPAESPTEAAASRPQSDPQDSPVNANQLDEAIEFRVEQQRPNGFKKSEGAFRKHLKRELSKRPQEVLEILDEKREAEESKGRSAPVEAKETDAEREARLKRVREEVERCETASVRQKILASRAPAIPVVKT